MSVVNQKVSDIYDCVFVFVSSCVCACLNLATFLSRFSTCQVGVHPFLAMLVCVCGSGVCVCVCVCVVVAMSKVLRLA